MRADAQRNRDRIVETARAVFGEQGCDASFDLIAKKAGVGAGTLYRHFPNRESLVNAVLQTWVDNVRDTAAKALARESSARDVLIGWLGDYVALISLHKGGPARLTTAMGDESSPIRTKCHVLSEAMGEVLAQLRAEGAITQPVDPVQACRLVGGVAAVADQSDLPTDAVGPLLEVVADGILAPR